MGIARALERVKQQAKQGGLNAVMVSLGEELRSCAIPAPLRGAAQRLAALFERERPPTAREDGDVAGERDALTTAAREQNAGEPRIGVSERYAEAHNARGHTREPGGSEAASSAVLPSLGTSVREERDASATQAAIQATGVRAWISTANDSGAVPAEPAPGTPVDPEAVGATPSVDATPIEAAPMDATPADATPTDATPTDAATIEHEAPQKREGESEPVMTAAVIEDVHDEDVRALDDELPVTAPGPQHSAPLHGAPTVPSPPLPLASSTRAIEDPPSKAARPRSQRARKGGGSAAAVPANDKEKLAADAEAAKTLARSSSRSAKKRSGAKGEPTSKKK